MNKLLGHLPFPVALSAAVLIAFIITLLSLSSCGILHSGGARTESIPETETSGLTESGGEVIVTDAYETTAKAEMTPREKLLELIRRENKSITGDFTAMEQWIWIYAYPLFPDNGILVSAERLEGGAALGEMSDEYTVYCERYNLVFSDGKSEAVSVIDVSINDNRYLVDLVIDGSVEKLNRMYVYDALKRDSRFNGSLYDSINNKYDAGISEYNITEITGRDPDIWYFNKLMTELDSKNVAKLYFESQDHSRTVCVTADLINKKILSEEPIISENPKSSDTVFLPAEIGGGKYIINQDQNSDLYITDKKNGERVLIYDSYTGDDISKIKVASLFRIYDDRLVIYRIGLYEGTAGFGIYNVETKENRLFMNELSPVFISGDMLYARSGVYSSNHGYIRIDLTGDLDEHYDMLALNGIDSLDPDAVSILSPDGKYLIFFMYDYESKPVRHILMVCDSIDGHIIDLFDIVANGCSPQYLRFTDDNILLILCERYAMCDDYIFTFDLRVLNKK